MSLAGPPLFLAELVLDQCPLHNPANGVPAAAGQVSCSATEPCSNTWFTCQAKCDYRCEPVSYWFSNCEVPGHLGVYDALPIIGSWDHQSTKLVPGSMFNGSGSIRICMQDLEACDGLGGFVLARLIEAQKYFEGRRLNVWQGDCNMPFEGLLKSTFYIDRVSGPSKDCEICLEGSDTTSLIGFDKAVCPPTKELVDVTFGQDVPLSLGVELQGAATASDPKLNPDLFVGKFILANNYVTDNGGVNDRCFLETRYLCAGSEMLEVIPCINENALPERGWNFELVERAVCGSELSAHANGDRLEMVKHITNTHAADVIRDLIQNCADLDQVARTCCNQPAESLLSEYHLEQYRCARPSDMISDVKFCDVEDVGELLESLANELNISIFFDDVCDQIVVRDYSPPAADAEIKIVMPDDIIRDSFEVKPTDERYTNVIYNHNLVDCTRGPVAGNFRCHVLNKNIDGLREVCDRREYKTTRDLIVNSRWINGANAYLATVNTIRWAARAACPPREVEFEVLPRFSRGFVMGDLTTVQHEKISSGGAYSTALWMFTGRKLLNNTVRMCFIETPWEAGEYRSGFGCGTAEAVTIGPRPEDLCELEQCTRVW